MFVEELRLLGWQMKPSYRDVALSCSVAFSSLLLHQPALAGGFTVVSGQTFTTTQTLNTAGDVGTIEEGGRISVSTGVPGITGDSSVIVRNAGIVEGGDNGIELEGLFIGGNNNTIVNSGTVIGASNAIFLGAVLIGGKDNTIVNSGLLSGGIRGIDISTSFGGVSDGNRITNSGVVYGGQDGIVVSGDGNTISNSGAVTGRASVGIAAAQNNSISNSGSIEGGIIGIGVINGNEIINSGTIVGDTAAVTFGVGVQGLGSGTNNTLTLLKGSNIKGNLVLGDASNKLIIGRGFSDAAFAYTGTPIIDTSAVNGVVVNGVVYVVNKPGYIEAQQDIVNDLTRVVTDTVQGRLAASRLSDRGMSVSMNGTTIAAAADVSAAPSNGFWLSGIGSWRDQQGSGNQYDFTTTLGGLMGGLDGKVAENTRFGIFGGFATGSMDADNEPQDLDSENFFGGAYLGQDWGSSFADVSVTAGWSNFDTSRQVLNNMVSGGVEQASGGNGGFLFSPSLKVGTNIETGGGTFTPSLRVRYAGLYLDSYKEDGSAADMSVDSRNINIFDARGELAYTLSPSAMAGGSLYQTVRMGIDGTISNADNVEATLAGQAFNFDVANDNLVRGYLGYDAVLAISDGASLNASAEAGYDSTDALTLQANGGITLTF